ncbi:MAG TPA: hypothetical protein VF477_12500 [Mycobacterium sp.]
MKASIGAMNIPRNAAAAGALGVLLAPIMDRIIISAAAVLLVAVLMVVMIDFFRSPD